jgi:hypothetical protein
MTGKLLPQQVWVFRCADGCEGLAWTIYKKRIVEIRKFHKLFTGHKGVVAREDFDLVQHL